MPASDFQSLPPLQLPQQAQPFEPVPPSGSQEGQEPYIDAGPDDAWNFVSPNVEEGLTYEKAYSLLHSPTQSKFRKMTEDMMQASGTKPEIYDAIGDWVDDDGKAGAENSVASIFKGQVDPKVVEYLASWQGLLRNQKGILTFQGQPGGKDSLYQIYVPDSDTNGIRDQLSRLGIQNRTIIPREGGGNLVVLFDEGRADRGKVAKFAEVYNARVREAEGTGQFFGGSTRTAARADYRERIRAFESGPSGHKSGSIRPSAGASGRDTSESPTRPRSEFQFKRKGVKKKFAAQRKLTPDEAILKHVQGYAKQSGIPYQGVDDYHEVDLDRAKKIAEWYEKSTHNPNDPKVKAAYDALKRESLAQFKYLQDQGVQLIPWTKEGQPYANSKEMMEDVRKNNRLYFFTGGDFTDDNPMVESTGIKVGDQDINYMGAFRAAHDYFGHALYGNQFGPRGEEHAWRTHSRMYSPDARPALSMETRGQNSWVNYGPHSGKPVTERPYAQQKVNILPEDLMQEGPSQPKPQPQTKVQTLKKRGPKKKYEGYRKKAGAGGQITRGIAFEGGQFLPKGPNPPIAVQPGPIQPTKNPVGGQATTPPSRSTPPVPRVPAEPKAAQGDAPRPVEAMTRDAELDERYKRWKEKQRQEELQRKEDLPNFYPKVQIETGLDVLETPLAPGEYYDTVQKSIFAGIDYALNSKNNPLPELKAKHFRAATTQILNAMPEQALKMFAEHNPKFSFHKSLSELGQFMWASFPGEMANMGLDLKQLKDGRVGGAWTQGILILDGEYTTESYDSATKYTHQIYAHEFGHVLDHYRMMAGGKFNPKGPSLTDDPKWFRRVEREAEILSKYAASSPTEAFAEFARALYARQVPQDVLRRVLPYMSGFFEEHGLWPHFPKTVLPGNKDRRPRKMRPEEERDRPLFPRFDLRRR